MYLGLFILGFAGLALMALFGFVHVGHATGHNGLHSGADSSSALGHSGHAIDAGHLSHSGTAHAHLLHSRAASAAHGQSSGVAVRARSLALSLLSPIDIFSFLIGAGLAGMIFTPLVGPTLVIVLAVVGAIAFDVGVTKQVLRLMLAFAAKPSEGLEGMVAQAATAATAFDSEGKGVIKLVLDGQTVQLLAHQDTADFAAGTKIAKGDTVVILEVDAKRNSCRVTRELSS